MQTPLRRAARRCPSRALAVAATTLCLTLSVTACSGDDSSSPASQPGAGGTSTGSDAAEEAASLETTATLGRVTGSLPKGKRSKVRRQVAHAVDEWFDAAYIDGEYPRNDFENAWPGFTVGARADAHADKALMSNQDIGGRIDAVEPLARKVTVDVLAVRGKAQGASARVLLKFKTDGDIHRKVEVRGRLFLIPSPEGWRIFGYDVTKGRAA